MKSKPSLPAAALVCLAALLASLAAFAQPESCPPPPAPLTPQTVQQLAQSARDHGFLWRFEKDGRAGYLYGTFHVNKLDWLFAGPKTLAAFRDSDLLALELDILDPEVQAKVSRPETLGIKTVALSEAQQKRMDAIARKVCAPAALMTGRHAVMQMVVATIFDARFAGLEAAYGTDFFLAGMAQSVGKPVKGLETPELQTQTLLGGDPKEMLEMVEGSLALFESGRQRAQTLRLAEVWGGGKLAELQNFEQWCECTNTEAERRFLRRVNDDRNPALAAAIDRLHRDGRHVFAAVGALHMAGPKALPGLLAGMGYKVERVAFATGP